MYSTVQLFALEHKSAEIQVFLSILTFRNLASYIWDGRKITL